MLKNEIVEEDQRPQWSNGKWVKKMRKKRRI